MPFVEQMFSSNHLSNSDRVCISENIDEMMQILENTLIEQELDSDGSCNSDMDVQMISYDSNEELTKVDSGEKDK